MQAESEALRRMVGEVEAGVRERCEVEAGRRILGMEQELSNFNR